MKIGPSGFGMAKRSMNSNALIIFFRIPEIGKVKTRLAKVLGDEKTLLVYKALIEKTITIAKDSGVDVFPFYSPYIAEASPWYKEAFLQSNGDLGAKMKNAFHKISNLGYKKACIIGSDCYQLNSDIIKTAYNNLDHNEIVIGPSLDGGYYLLGMKKLDVDLFSNMAWSTENVYSETCKRIGEKPYALLKELNDIDTIEDLRAEPELYKMVNY